MDADERTNLKTQNALRELAVQERELTVRLFQLLNAPSDLRDLMRSVTGLLRDWVGCEAVGIRLRKGGDFPYFETSGFRAAFIEKENNLCVFDDQGQIVLNSQGDPVLGCMCGRVLCGRFDPSKPYFTSHGSFWSNNATASLAGASDATGQSHPRTGCRSEGYESVALIPLRTANRIFGVLQFNDHRPDLFSSEQIALFERLADALAIALSQRQAIEALRESEERYRRITEGLTDYQYTVRVEDGRAVETTQSPACALVTGYTPKEFAEDPYLWIHMVAPQHRELVRERVHQVLAGGEIPPIEHLIHRRDGEARWVIDTIIPHKDAFGKLLSYDGVIKDITDRKRSEEEKLKLETQTRQLQKSESLGRMAGAIAHHFNNQLETVMLSLDMLRGDLARGMDAEDTLNGAMQAARRAAEVSGLMLTYLGQSRASREPMDFAATCLQALPLLLLPMPKRVNLKTEIPNAGPVIRSDASQIRQILANLLTNAWEAIVNCGSICLAVKTVASAEIPIARRFPIDWQPQNDAYACLEVHDSGTGISPADFEKLFDPFFSSKFTGRGLGLPVVLGIVRAHEGVITVESQPGQGSIFRIFFPVDAKTVSSQKNKSAESAPTVNASASEAKPAGAVLLVEDEISLRKVAANALKALGLKVFVAVDGVEAVELFQLHRDEISLVLCDLTMPRMDGWETILALRKLSPAIPVILSSGYDEARVMRGDHPEMPQAFLSKPYEFETLKRTVFNTLNGVSAIV
jgi:PAS domain S-box-containing protein